MRTHTHGNNMFIHVRRTAQTNLKVSFGFERNLPTRSRIENPRGESRLGSSVMNGHIHALLFSAIPRARIHECIQNADPRFAWITYEPCPVERSRCAHIAAPQPPTVSQTSEKAHLGMATSFQTWHGALLYSTRTSAPLERAIYETPSGHFW